MPLPRRKLFIAASVELILLVLAFLLFALSSDENTVRARRLITFLMIAESLVLALVPLFAVREAAQKGFLEALVGVLQPVGWTLAVTTAAPLSIALVFDRGALLGWLMAKLVCVAIGSGSAGLVLLIARLIRKPAPAFALAALLIMGFLLQPFYTRPAISGLRGRPAAQKLLIDSGVRTPWMATAHAMLAARPTGWKYMPVTSPYLYNRWVGTDYPVNVPGNGRYLLESLIFAAVCVVLARLSEILEPAREIQEPETDG